MREFKFRAMYKGKMELIEGYGSANNGVFELDVELDSPLMQFTGLKDKNGKEIFEGDIVQFISNDKLLNKTGVVTWDDEGADYNITGKHEGLDTEFECAFGLTDGEYDVLGNIYVNPELLNNQSK